MGLVARRFRRQKLNGSVTVGVYRYAIRSETIDTCNVCMILSPSACLDIAADRRRYKWSETIDLMQLVFNKLTTAQRIPFFNQNDDLNYKHTLEKLSVVAGFCRTLVQHAPKTCNGRPVPLGDTY
jgi:hypothetical protein